jgi:hypothetical protein
VPEIAVYKDDEFDAAKHNVGLSRQISGMLRKVHLMSP